MRRFFRSGITLALLVILPLVAEANTCYLKQSTALSTGMRMGPFLDETDGKTAETALTLSQADVRLSKAEGAFAQKNDATSCTHLENGWYKCPLDATDTNTLGLLVVAIHESGALPVWKECMVLPATVYDALVTNAVGAAGGLFGVGTNASLAITGALTVGGGVAITQSSSNAAGLSVAGNGSGAGIAAAGGATGDGFLTTGGATSGHGINAVATTAGSGITAVGVGTTRPGINATGGSVSSPGMKLTGGGTGAGLDIAAGATGVGVKVATTAGDGISVTPTAGSALVLTANGTSKHGAVITGGTAGTSDGLKAVAGSGGVDIRGSITGSLSGSVGSVAATSGGVTLMAVDAYLKGSTSVIYGVLIRDATTGAGMTGLTSASVNLAIYYCRADQGNAACSSITPAAATKGSYTSGGFVEKDATGAPGVYEFGIPTATLATGADLVTIYFSGVSGMIPTMLPIALVDFSVANINTKLGTPAGASVSADILTANTAASAIKAKTDSLTFTGTDVGAIVNTYATGKTPLQPTTAGRTLTVSAAGNGSVNWGDVENPTTSVGLTGTTISTSQQVASVSGAVGSVTGAVGSVTGSVGSVTGAVGSVTGAVGSVTGNVGGNVSGNVTGSVGSVVAASPTGGTVRKNVASQTYPVYLVLTSDHITPATGKSPAVQVSKDGAGFGNIAGSVAEIGNGWYLISFAQADTNCNSCAYRVTAASSDTRNFYAVTGP